MMMSDNHNTDFIWYLISDAWVVIEGTVHIWLHGDP